MEKQQSGGLAGLEDPGRPLRASMLLALSDARPDTLRELRASLPQIPVDRRRKIVRRLVEVSEDDAEADFRNVLRVFLKDSDAEVRAAALDGLWEDESLSLLDEATGLLARDPDATVRAAAARTLATFAMTAALGELKGGRGPVLRQALEAAYRRAGEDQEVRCQALRALGYFDDDGVSQIVAEAYQRPEPELKASAICAMGANLSPRWARSVRVELASAHAAIRFEAATAAGQMELKEAVPDLVELTADSDTDVRLAAISALGQIGGLVAKRALRALSKSSNEATREAANSALEEMLFLESPLSLPDGGLPVALPAKPKAGRGAASSQAKEASQSPRGE